MNFKNSAVKGKFTPNNKNKFLGKKDPIYRSLWERRFMMYCDRSEAIKFWDSESFHIPYMHPKEKRMRNYYPDFYVDYIDRYGNPRKKLIEIKPRYQMKWHINRAKWAAAKEYCDEYNMEFQVLTERELF